MAKIENMKFTEMAVKNLKKGGKYRDSGRQRGQGSLYLRVSASTGLKTFTLHHRVNGKLKESPVGHYPDMSVAEAKDKANELLKDGKSGFSIAAEKKKHRDAPILSDLWEDYRRYQENLIKIGKGKKSFFDHKRRWKKEIEPYLGKMKIKDIKPYHISDLVYKKAEDAATSANRLHSLLSVIFSHGCDKKGFCESNPVMAIKKPVKEVPRERCLTDSEIKVVWNHLDKLSYNQRDIFKILFYTAARSMEIMSLKWSDIDWKDNSFTVVDTKTTKLFLIPISPQVRKILEDRASFKNLSEVDSWIKESEFVFPSRHNKDGHASRTTYPRYEIIEKNDMENWETRDIRRTTRTLMSRVGKKSKKAENQIKPHIAELCLNHSVSKIIKIYDRFDYQNEKEDALIKVANFIDEIVSG